MPAIPDPLGVLSLSARLCCVGILLQSLELLSLHAELKNQRLLGWSGAQGAANIFRRWAQWAQGYPMNALVLISRALAAGAILLLPQTAGTTGAALLIMLLIAQLHFNRGSHLFFANSDHMNLVCLAGFSVAALPTASDTLRGCALAFVGFQACLGYVASGLDKLKTPQWRTGGRLVHIAQDSSHRIPALGRMLARQPWLARPLAWSVMLLEVLFPLSVVLPPAGFWFIIVGGLIFHASIAILMALPGFFWAFAAAYPALYFVREWLALIGGP